MTLLNCRLMTAVTAIIPIQEHSPNIKLPPLSNALTAPGSAFACLLIKEARFEKRIGEEYRVSFGFGTLRGTGQRREKARASRPQLREATAFRVVLLYPHLDVAHALGRARRAPMCLKVP
jgi:hypothetical protein